MKTKYIIMPSWAKFIRMVRQDIDGYAPYVPVVLPVGEFMKRFAGLQKASGGGEWAVHIFACETENEPHWWYPYGQENGFRQIRGCRVYGKRVRKVASYDYMRWHRLIFVNAQKQKALNEIQN